MNPHLSSTLGRRSRWPSMLILAATVVAGACDRAQDQLAPDALSPQFAPGGEAPFTVVVKDYLGDPVGGALVRLVDSNGNAQYLPATGVLGTYFANVATGKYCVSVQMLPVSAAVQPVIAPHAVPGDLPGQLPLRTDLSPTIVSKNGVVTWTSDVWTDCVKKPPTNHAGSGTSLTVVLAKSYEHKLTLAGPDGKSLFASTPAPDAIVGWAASLLPRQTWPAGYELDPDLKDAFLQSVDIAQKPQSLSETPPVLKFGLAPGPGDPNPLSPTTYVPFQIEFQQSATREGRTVNFTATLKTVNETTLFAEPLYCNQKLDEYPTLAKFELVNYGYMAEARKIEPGDKILTNVLLPSGTQAIPSSPLNAVAMELRLVGNEAYTVSFREDFAGGGRNSTDVSFTCSGADCSPITQKTSGGSPHIVFAFSRELTLNSNLFKVTLFLTGLSKDHTSVTFAAKAAGTGEAIPLPDRGKGKAQAAFTVVPKPKTLTSCPVEDSNDDKLSLRG
jgi:hypothetical protein